VLVEHAGEGKVVVMPLFVAITEDMKIVFEGETGGAARRAAGPNAEWVNLNSLGCSRHVGFTPIATG
jgi:hypothetical protein